MIGYIYCITCDKTNKVYIGQVTHEYHRRFNRHLRIAFHRLEVENSQKKKLKTEAGVLEERKEPLNKGNIFQMLRKGVLLTIGNPFINIRTVY